MSQVAPPFIPEQYAENRRRFQRYLLAVPVDVVVLRSGIPDTIPGRSIDVGEGGVGAVMAGELRPGESVGIELRLPFVIETVQAKAMVRYQALTRCGLQFLAMRPEQQGALHTWTRMAAESSEADKQTGLAAVREHVERPQEPVRQLPQPLPSGAVKRLQQPVSRRVRRRSHHRRRWPWPLLFLIAAVAAVGWWWHSGWAQLEMGAPSTKTTGQQRIQVPGSVMEQRIMHRVEPVYPAEAEKSKLQGMVVLNAVIGADGSVTDLHPVRGPEVLARAAMDAVKWWRFQPYQANGQPVPVETTIEVDFRLADF